MFSIVKSEALLGVSIAMAAAGFLLEHALLESGQIAALKDERAQALQAQRQAFDAARAALIEKQDAERAKIRQAWQQIPRDRQFPKNGPARSEPRR